ncbi:MAG TPA: hypothetical protein VHE35_36285 [Kofleriaceae bacterium]|nr:hypothetical protein [Kofleriaceae bacterium]
MRPNSTSARGVLCALALAALCSPAAAGPHKKTVKRAKVSIASCTSFDQLDRDTDDGVDLVVSNRCDVRLACSVSWSLTCRPAEGKSRRSQHGEAFSLATDATQSTAATIDACGNDGWQIDDVSWSCQPDPEPKQVADR